jgi:hypothetical protein
MYLADNVIHLRYKSHESPERRDMKIIKCRSSRHSRYWHPYKIVKGSGIIIQEAPLADEAKVQVVDLRPRLAKAISTLPEDKKKLITPRISQSINRTVQMLSREDIGSLDPDYIIHQILSEYGLTDD